MKLLVLLTFVAVGQGALFGSRKCTWGPSYWCSHLDHARECSAMEHCITKVWKNQLQELTGSTENCFDVIKILDDVRHAGISNLEKMAESCTKMTAEKRSMCKELVKNNQHEVMHLLQSDLPSVNIASVLGLCGRSSKPVQFPQMDNEQDIQKSGNYCTDCLNFFRDLQEIVNNTGESIAEKLKEKVCTKLGYFENLCKQTVDTYTGFIITILAQQLNPEDVCFLFQLCASEAHEEWMKSIQYIAAKAQLHKLECDVCQDIAKDIQNTLRDTALQNDILSTLENKVCPLLPGDLANQCKSYVSAYGPMVFQVLVAEMDPPTICETLGFCNATQTEKKPALVSVPLRKAVTTVRLLSPDPRDEVQFSPLCSLCEEVMEKLDSIIVTNATEEEIVADLEKVCSLIPEKLRADCDSFVDGYGERIIELLKNLAPEAVCTALGLCVGDQPVHVDLSMPVVKGDQECTACETIVAYFKQYIANPDNTKIIEDLLDDVCVIVPSSYKGLCEELIDTYAPTLIKLMDKYDDPEKVCTGLGLCKSKERGINESGSGPRPLLFMPMAELQPAQPRVDCSQGPEVWCSSMDNARHCGAVKYCQENKQMED